MGPYGALWSARLRMLRPGNAVMAAVGVLVGIVLVGDPRPATSTWIAAPLAAAFVTGFGNVLNDLNDRDLDRVAHPGRPLPSGRISVQDAKAFAALLLGFGLVEAFLAGGSWTFLFALANAALLALYELRLKRMGLPGNLLVGLLVASTFLFGAVAAHGDLGGPVLWSLAAMALLTNAARELVKDCEDAAADRGRRRSVPVVFGTGVALLTAFLFVQIAVGLSVWTAWRSSWPLGAWVVLALAGTGFQAGAFGCWFEPRGAQQVLKLAMVAALGAFLCAAWLAG